MTTLKEAYNEIIKSNLGDPEDRKAYLQDLTEHGAISGMVSGLIYFHETTEFFDTHKDEIVAMLDEMKEETGLDESKLFGDKWRTWEEIAEDFESTVDMDDYETEDDYFHTQMKEHNEFIENIDETGNLYIFAKDLEKGTPEAYTVTDEKTKEDSLRIVLE